jgi:hypothetical protein
MGYMIKDNTIAVKKLERWGWIGGVIDKGGIFDKF